jgi:sec-independent protein translocase protein TatA
MFGLGPTELIVIAVIVLLIFGAKRLPEIGKGLGGAIREFRNIKKDLDVNEIADEGQGRDLEEKIVDKVVEQVPGAKEAIEVKKKAENIKKIIKYKEV